MRMIPKSKRFTPTFLDQLSPGDKRYEVADTSCKGLRLRVAPTGLKSFVQYYQVLSGKHKGKHKVKTFGRWPDMGIAEAHDALKDAKKNRQAETDRGASAVGKPQTVSELFERYYAKHVDGKVTDPQEIRRKYETDVRDYKAHTSAKPLGERSISLIEVQDLSAVLIDVQSRSNEGARKLRSLLTNMFSFAAVLGCIPFNPMTEVGNKVLGIEAYKRRTRALDVDSAGVIDTAYPQTKALLNVLRTHEQMSKQVSIGLQLLLMLGLRSGELRMSRWADLDIDKAVLTIPIENMKTEQVYDWRVPLPSQAVALFKDLRQYTGNSQFIFGSDEVEEDQPIGDKVFGRAMNRLFTRKTPRLTFEPATAHDLRRTCRTMLTHLGVNRDVAELCLNHAAPGIVGVYDRETRLDDRREALQRFADRLDLIVSNSETVRLLA